MTGTLRLFVFPYASVFVAMKKGMQHVMNAGIWIFLIALSAVSGLVKVSFSIEFFQYSYIRKHLSYLFSNHCS
jgi:hypothetical protein